MLLNAHGKPWKDAKCSIAECVSAGATGLLFHCLATPTYAPVATVCHHSGKMPIADAIARWGEGCRLQEVRVRCSKCGGRMVEVRPGWPDYTSAHYRARR